MGFRIPDSRDGRLTAVSMNDAIGSVTGVMARRGACAAADFSDRSSHF